MFYLNLLYDTPVSVIVNFLLRIFACCIHLSLWLKIIVFPSFGIASEQYLAKATNIDSNVGGGGGGSSAIPWNVLRFNLTLYNFTFQKKKKIQKMFS